MRARSLVFLVAMALLVVACSRKAALLREAADGPASVATSAGSAAAGQPEMERRSQPRKLVRTGQLRLEVESYLDARVHLDRELERAGGYVAEARVEHADGAVASAQLELRIPAPELERFMRDTARLGTVLAEDLRSSEITDEYYDAQARLANARRLEHRLLEFASQKTPDVKALLEAERELGRVRDEVETLQGRLQRYDDQVALSVLSIQIISRQRLSVGEALGLGGKLRHALAESAHALVDTGEGLLLVLAVLVPWSPLMGLAAYAMSRMRRAWRSRRASLGARRA
jgi:hypothetical protein